MSWSPDGRHLFVSESARAEGRQIHAIPSDDELRRGARLTAVVSKPSEARALKYIAWSPDRPDAFACVVDRQLEFWTVDGGRSEEISYPVERPGSDARIAWSGPFVASSAGNRIWIYDVVAGRFTTELGGHTRLVVRIAFSPDGRYLASVGWDSTLRLWRTADWQEVGVVDLHLDAKIISSTNWVGLAFHPTLPVLTSVAVGGGLGFYHVDDRAVASAPPISARYAVAKVVLVGESGVGKTGLGYRLATNSFKEHPSTHGQQFWLTESLAVTRADGTRCEVVLWDLAGQPDYRLIHVLFLDDADTALIVFDAARRHEALDAVTFWSGALRAARPGCRTILVSARSDRGNAAVTDVELAEFAERCGIGGGHHETSALTGAGVDDLVELIRRTIPWDELPMIVESPVLAGLKEEVLRVKEERAAALVARDELDRLIGQHDATPEEIDAALRDLEVRGYVRVLSSVSGERIVLLRPEILNNLAASLILEARRNERGLGALDEAAVTDGTYGFREMTEVPGRLGRVLAESVVALLLDHNVCFRERLGDRSLLIFPELINEKPPRLAEGTVFVDDVTYVVRGAVENVYASLVVLLGYTNVLTRVDQWQNQAHYDFDGHLLRFRQVRPSDDTLEVVLSYAEPVPEGVRRVFEGLVEQFLSRRRVEVGRYPSVACPECGFTLDRAQVIRFTDDGAEVTYCPRGGHSITLPRIGGAERMSEAERRVLRQESAAARLRTAFSVAMTRFRAYVTDLSGQPPKLSCFVSYAWGDAATESWVRDVLVPDLEQAGVDVVLDVATNVAGASLTRFVERVDATDHVLVIGTPAYLVKYRNRDEHFGTVVAAEGDLINSRLLGPEKQKATVIPVLRVGGPDESLPPLLRTRLAADFRDDHAYFPALLDLILVLYRIEARLPVMRELRETLTETARQV